MARKSKGTTELVAKIKPLGDRVLVKRLDQEEVKKGGIIIPDTAKEKPQEAEVIAVGPGRRTEGGDLVPSEVKPGQRVLIGKYSGTEVEFGGQEYLILKEDEILGILQ